MTGLDLVLLGVGLLTAASAVMTVISRNLVHAALFLAVALAGIAGVFLVLRADFLALVQLVVYVGAVAVLFLFGLMLTRAPIGREALDSQHRGLALGVSGTLFAVLSWLIVDAFGDVRVEEVAGPRIGELGIALFRDWVLPFEVLSMLLLAALVGAIVLSRREDGESGEPEPVVPIALADDPDADPDAAPGTATPSDAAGEVRA